MIKLEIKIDDNEVLSSNAIQIIGLAIRRSVERSRKNKLQKFRPIAYDWYREFNSIWTEAGFNKFLTQIREDCKEHYRDKWAQIQNYRAEMEDYQRLVAELKEQMKTFDLLFGQHGS